MSYKVMTRETIHDMVVEVNYFDDYIEALNFMERERRDDITYGEGDYYQYNLKII